LVDLGNADLGFAPELGAGAHEPGVMQLEHALLLVGQPQAVAALIEILNARENLRVEHHCGLVRGELWRDFALNSLQRLVRVRARQVVERRAHAAEAPPTALQRADGIGETRPRGLGGDLGDLGLVLFECQSERRRKVWGLDRLEGREPERRRPFAEQRVAARRSRPRYRPRVATRFSACPLAPPRRPRRWSFARSALIAFIRSLDGRSNRPNRPDKKNGPVGKPARTCSGTLGLVAA